MVLSQKLRTPLQELKRQTTSSEFVRWCFFLQKRRQAQLNENSKQDHYLAQIALEIRRLQHIVLGIMGGHKSSTDKISDFLIKFELDDKKKKQYDWRKSKASWMMWAGMREDGTQIKK